jgi:protein-tyrosine phosphatase
LQSRILTLVPLLALLLAAPAPAQTLSSHPGERTIVLNGKRNLRSLDGLPVRGGVLRSGALYRSAKLTGLKPYEVDRIKALHLSTLVDVRFWLETVVEGADSKAVVRTVPHHLMLPMGVEVFPHDDFYVAILHNHVGRKSIGRFFAALADPASYPLLYHCAAGQDRTGTLTALLLDLLGTPREVIMDDYLASGKETRPAWMESVFTEVDKAGGIEPFLHGYGVTDAQIAAVRTNLVVPAR